MPPFLCHKTGQCGIRHAATGHGAGRRVGKSFRKLARIDMRAVLAILPLLFVSACANPWTKVPEAELPKPIRSAMARPSPFVIGNYCGPGTRTGDLSARPVDRLDAACQIHDACYIARHNHCDCDGALIASSRAIRDDRTASRKMRSEAELLIATFAVPICKIFPQGFMPPRDPAQLSAMKPGATG